MRTALGTLLLLLTSVTAGLSARGTDFRLEVGPPIAGAGSLLKKGKAVVAVRALACDPGAVAITGRAEGIVNGTRQSLALRLLAAETPGVFMVGRQWDAGRWVLVLAGTCAERKTVAATIVPLGPDGFIRDAVATLTRAAAPADIDAALSQAKTVTE